MKSSLRKKLVSLFLPAAMLLAAVPAAAPAGASGTAVHYVYSESVSDLTSYTLDMDFKIISNSLSLVFGSYTLPQRKNYYRWTVTSAKNTLTAASVSDGTSTTFGTPSLSAVFPSGSVPLNTAEHLRIAVSKGGGNTAVATFINGTQVDSRTLAADIPLGKLGFYQENGNGPAEIDNLRIADGSGKQVYFCGFDNGTLANFPGGTNDNGWYMPTTSAFTLCVDDTPLPRTEWSGSTNATTGEGSPARAFDSNTDSRWAAKSGSTTTKAVTTDKYFQLDTGTLNTFNKIEIDCESRGIEPDAFNAEVSADGTTYTRVASNVPVGGLSMTTNPPGGLGVTTIAFSAVSARYVRIYPAVDTRDWWEIRDLNLFNDESASVTTTVGANNTLTAAVQNPVAGNTYQLWAYQKVDADVAGQATDQYIWTPMTAGDNYTYTLTGVSPDTHGSYLVSMVETDGSGSVIGCSYDSMPAAVETAKIQKLLVDGAANLTGRVNVDKAASDTTHTFEIDAANASAYTLTYGAAGNETAVMSDADNANRFTVNFAGLGTGKYVFTATARGTDGTSDTRTLTVTTYSIAGASHATPVISGMTGGFVGNSLGLTLTGADTQGNVLKNGDGFLYRFRAGEPGRGLNYAVSSTVGPTGSVPVPVGKYGAYQVYATAAYGTSVAYDDAALGYYDYTRPGGAVTVSSYTVKVNDGAASSATDQTGTTGKTYTFNATADTSKLAGGETARYSFWRCDASGWVLLKDWSPDATLSWTPAYAGKYILQVRVQGSNAGSYESERNMTFDVSSVTGLATAKNVSLALTVTGSTARQPVVLTTQASGQAAADRLLYRYQVQDPTLGQTLLNAYSPDNTFTWVPRKAGTWKVTAEVINQNSFGMYDAETSLNVTVQ